MKDRDCSICKHYLASGEYVSGDEIYACECWECEFEPKDEIMSLDEAINHCEEVVREKESLLDSDYFAGKLKNDCKDCCEAHRQLANWLRELKAYKEKYEYSGS